MTSPSFVDPELLRRVQALELRAREVAEGVLLGIHHAPHRGRSIEFAEHKEYSPGDDIRRIDWKLYGKTDRLFIKEFEDDTNISVLMLVDGSRSMEYKGENGERTSKLELARTLSAALSYLLLAQSDAVGVGLFSTELSEYLPPRARKAHFHEITTRLAAARPEQGTNLATSLSDLAARIKGRAMIIVFSDLFDEPGPMLKAMRLLAARRHELVVFHLLDPDEIEFPFERLTVFEDMEGPARLMVDPRSIQEAYLGFFGEFLEEVRTELSGVGVDYRIARNDETPAAILTSWLGFRAATPRPSSSISCFGGRPSPSSSRPCASC